MSTTNPVYAALAAFAPAQVFDIDPNRAACREENQRQMEARAMRESAARAQAAMDRLESACRPTYGALELMKRQTGSFAASLAQTYTLADSTNQEKLVALFGDMFARYSANAAMVFSGDAAAQARA
ncbi:hypothetical protein [Robbsia andropogonis]|nr:hypothetical protein [Robbsia andropogonis]